MRLLHTSDVHIGDDYDPEKRLAGMTAVVDAALTYRADALLIVGDLFDSARVKPPQILDSLEQLARLSIPTVVTPGNHDCLDRTSIYQRVPFAEAGHHVHFLDDPEGSHLTLDELRVSIWSRALVDHHPGHRPLEGYRPANNGYWQIALAHGHYVPEGETSDRSSLIHEAEIAALTCDYLALGHWHRFLDCSANGIPAYYPGCPSEPGGSFASANLVVLDPETGARVERVPLDGHSPD